MTPVCPSSCFPPLCPFDPALRVSLCSSRFPCRSCPALSLDCLARLCLGPLYWSSVSPFWLALCSVPFASSPSCPFRLIPLPCPSSSFLFLPLCPLDLPLSFALSSGASPLCLAPLPFPFFSCFCLVPLPYLSAFSLFRVPLPLPSALSFCPSSIRLLFYRFFPLSCPFAPSICLALLPFPSFLSLCPIPLPLSPLPFLHPPPLLSDLILEPRSV